jgi:hypothetical protein
MNLSELIDKNTATRSDYRFYAKMAELRNLHKPKKQSDILNNNEYNSELVLQEQLLFMDFYDKKVDMDYVRQQYKIMGKLQKNFLKMGYPVHIINNITSLDAYMYNSSSTFEKIQGLMMLNFSDTMSYIFDVHSRI